jgi:hypothetical protein
MISLFPYECYFWSKWGSGDASTRTHFFYRLLSLAASCILPLKYSAAARTNVNSTSPAPSSPIPQVLKSSHPHALTPSRHPPTKIGIPFNPRNLALATT